MIKFIIFAILLFEIHQANANGPLCKNLFNKNKLDATTSFIAYFQESLDKQIIGEKDLQSFAESLKNNQPINPIPHEQTPFGPLFTKASHQIHYEAFQKFIIENNLNIKAIKDWTQHTIEEKKAKHKNREDTKTRTTGIHQMMEFHRIEPGSFMMGTVNEQVPVSITKPFEMMSTQVTQMMWSQLKILFGEKEVSKINPSHFSFGDESRIHQIDGLEIRMQADHPVENISWNDVNDLIVNLNEFSKSENPHIQEILLKIIPSHKKGDRYRLPTEAEWEFVLRGRGYFNKTFHFGDQKEQLEDYAWFNDNSNKQTHAVGEKKPLIIESKKFYDLNGNVWEWVSDWYQNTLLGGTDPQGPIVGTCRVCRGGGWNFFADGNRSDYRESYWKPQDHEWFVGFRLVREVQ